jgi:two-component system, sensor histidine kinase
MDAQCSTDVAFLFEQSGLADGIWAPRRSSDVALPRYPLVVGSTEEGNTMQLPDNQIKAFLDAAPDAMVIIDNGGAIAFVNAQAEALFGYHSAELVGHSVEKLLPERFRTTHPVYRAQYLLASRPQPRPMGSTLELFGRRRDGTEFAAEVSLSPVEVDGRRFVSSAIRDATDHKAIERELTQARREAERANRAKSAFLATASHDLREPLHTLTLLSRTLSQSLPASSKAAYLVATQESTLRSMAELLNSLLSLSQIDAGVIQPQVCDCPLAPVFERLRADLAPTAAAKGVELVMARSDDVVRTDPTLLGEIIQNLLTNAIRYTQKGRVRLRSLEVAGAVRIEVEDTGVGIPRNELELIFEEFYQAPRLAGQRREGLGLGLSIVRRLAALLEHPLEVESTPGVGSRFAVAVPRGDPSLAIEPPPAADMSRIDRELAGRLVLVVDDQASMAYATAMMLDSMGCDVVVANSGGQARIRLLEQQRAPDLMLCDFRLNRGENGIDVVRAIRKAARWSVPAILLSGDTSAATPGVLEDLDGCQLLSKPVNADELMGLVARLLH